MQFYEIKNFRYIRPRRNKSFKRPSSEVRMKSKQEIKDEIMNLTFERRRALDDGKSMDIDRLIIEICKLQWVLE